MNSYRFSSTAHSDMEKIALYIQDLNPPAADHFVDAVERTCQMLAEHPLMGRSRSRSELEEDLRSFAIGNYLVFYFPAVDGINVARIIYDGRDLPKIFTNA